MPKATIIKPHANVPMVDKSGIPTSVWYSVLDQMVQTINNLHDRVNELEN